MFLIVGLGNPGSKYENTRHNMGFRTIDLLSKQIDIEINKEAFDGLLGRGNFENKDVLLFKPTTFMNLSGTAVQQVVHFFKIPLENIIVIFDDMAIKPGAMRMRLSGSSGGQKGMQNIIDCLNSENIKRIRIGIGEPEHNGVDHVLTKPLKEEEELIAPTIEKACEAIKEAVKTTFEKSMSKYN